MRLRWVSLAGIILLQGRSRPGTQGTTREWAARRVARARLTPPTPRHPAHLSDLFFLRLIFSFRCCLPARRTITLPLPVTL